MQLSRLEEFIEMVMVRSAIKSGATVYTDRGMKKEIDKLFKYKANITEIREALESMTEEKLVAKTSTRFGEHTTYRLDPRFKTLLSRDLLTAI